MIFFGVLIRRSYVCISWVRKFNVRFEPFVSLDKNLVRCLLEGYAGILSLFAIVTGNTGEDS